MTTQTATTKIQNHLSRNITYLRKVVSRTSQQKLGDSLGIKRQSLSSYETGIIEPNIEVLCILSQAWKITIDRLINTDLTIYNGSDMGKFNKEYEICRTRKTPINEPL